MQKIFIKICALVLLTCSNISIKACPKSKTIADAKKEVALKQSHPDLAFMGKVLMIIGGMGYLYLSLLKSRKHHHANEAAQTRCQKFQHDVFQFSHGTCIAGIIGYCIGKKYYPSADSSLENLFSRTALAQKIFNV